MSVYHSPGCRIVWTDVDSGGVDRDVVVPEQRMTLLFGLTFDNNVRQGWGYFKFDFALINLQDGNPHHAYWYDSIPNLPGTTGSIWVSKSWSQAWDAFNQRGLFLYRPTATFWFSESGPDPESIYEYAVAEEDHYIRIPSILQ